MSTPSNITPADLARFIHPVPVGATIPAGMKFVRRYMDGSPIPALAGPITHDFDIEAGYSPLWTAEPLSAPKPPLPTEVRAVIADVRGPMCSTCHVMTLDGDGEWLGVDADGVFTAWTPDLITDWKPARIVIDEAVSTAEPDLMDESDKRPRIDSDGDRWHWEDGAWRYVSCGPGGASSLALVCRDYGTAIVGWADRREDDLR